MERSAIRESAVVERPATACNLWVADSRQVTFSCLSKKKSPKRRHPGARENPLRSSPHRALANSPGAYYAPRAQTRARLNTPGGAAVLGARYGAQKSYITNAPSNAVAGVSEVLLEFILCRATTPLILLSGEVGEVLDRREIAY